MTRIFDRMRAAVVAFVPAFLPMAGIADEAVNTDANNVAIGGYDAVAYHTEARPTPGVPQFSFMWHDAFFHFATEANRDLFASDPERYAPHFGGFCAGGMSLGRRYRVDPEHWVIVDGKLYLAASRLDIDNITEDPQAIISAADRNWKTLGATQ